MGQRLEKVVLTKDSGYHEIFGNCLSSKNLRRKKKFGRIELSKMVVLPKNPEHDQLSIIQLMLVKQQ